MAFKNNNVTPAKQAQTPRLGDAAPDAMMPANNTGTFPVKLGAGQKSKFAKNASKGVTAANQPTGSDKAKIPAHNGPRSNVQLGTTKHGTGSVPGYLRGK